MAIKILMFDGSGREDSYNFKLLKAAEEYALSKGAEVRCLNISELNIPIYNGDYEQKAGIPKTVQALKNTFDEYDAYVIASPEYNGGVSGLLKNTIDWLSRQQNSEKKLQQFNNKIAALMSASPGRLGGMRGLSQLNSILWGLGVLVIPQIVSVPFYDKAIDHSGKVVDKDQDFAIQQCIDALIKTTTAIKEYTPPKAPI